MNQNNLTMNLIAAAIVAIVVVTPFLTLFIKRYITNWLDSKFNERLQDIKYRQSIALKDLEIKIGSQLDRAVKLNQFEFEVLPKAWRKMVDSFNRAKQLFGGLKTYPDINRMSGPEFDEFVSKITMTTFEKEKFRTHYDKQRFYQDWRNWKEFVDARNSNVEASLYILTEGILIDPAIKSVMDKITTIVHSFLTEYEINEESKLVPRMHESLDRLHGEGADLIAELERMIRLRIWPKIDEVP